MLAKTLCSASRLYCCYGSWGRKTANHSAHYYYVFKHPSKYIGAGKRIRYRPKYAHRLVWDKS